MYIVPMSFREAAAFVDDVHRHHRAPRGMKFAVGLVENGQVVGVAMAGRPVARALDDGRTLEVNRVATDGTRNACSALYGAVRRAAKALGYRRLVTYTQHDEGGASLRAAGWRLEAQLPPRDGWDGHSVGRPRADIGTGGVERLRWVIDL